jgi:hypothetical protein
MTLRSAWPELPHAARMGSIETEPGAPGGDASPSPFALLFAPDRAMERQAKVGRARWLLLFAWIAALLLAVAMSARVDAHAATIRKLAQSGKLAEVSDRQLAEETQGAERLFIVGAVASGVLGPPISLGMSCVAAVTLIWFFRGRRRPGAVVPIAAATMLPGAIATLLDAASALMHAALPPEGATLSPRTLSAILKMAGRAPPMPWIKLGSALDFFSLWAAVMMGFGVAAAGQVPRRTAVIGTLVAWVCYRLLTHVAVGG